MSLLKTLILMFAIRYRLHVFGSYADLCWSSDHSIHREYNRGAYIIMLHRLLGPRVHCCCIVVKHLFRHIWGYIGFPRVRKKSWVNDGYRWTRIRHPTLMSREPPGPCPVLNVEIYVTSKVTFFAFSMVPENKNIVFFDCNATWHPNLK